mmetsp:Transcript_1586/g.5241  ORF Transcript_1586/g.5241 Transcript_1586/m.5241 type:complete len:147 (-) Transcript_1586:182-622(-)|eukprot:CAMPEP_0182616964 /NCGR_PEP_ID=MMETSP1330-20130603/40287_1 /TAXON_ID=464278 /ORGANISM="Picochlorum sp., Strain RCC944" /LENGTH=146 /DNA_ID=CAMNT_0024837053 /DNA_START=252 /DNA_END=692 /DNA_ORIENTATION=+
MKTLRNILILSLFTSGMFISCAEAKKGDEGQQNDQNKPSITHVDANAFESAIAGDENAVILDVRTPDEYADGHIKGAVNINYYDDDFAKQVASKLPKDKTVYVYCKAGGRSAKSCNILSKNGYTSLVDLKVGFDGWKDAGKAVNKE